MFNTSQALVDDILGRIDGVDSSPTDPKSIDEMIDDAIGSDDDPFKGVPRAKGDW